MNVLYRTQRLKGYCRGQVDKHETYVNIKNFYKVHPNPGRPAKAKTELNLGLQTQRTRAA